VSGARWIASGHRLDEPFMPRRSQGLLEYADRHISEDVANSRLFVFNPPRYLAGVAGFVGLG
jgi:hypothetical protein